MGANRTAIVAMAVALSILAAGVAGVASGPVAPVSPPAAPGHAIEIEFAFRQGVTHLQAKDFRRAADAFHEVLRFAPAMPEAHVNMGFAMLGLARVEAARDFFESATALRPDQANAYYGMAVALEALGDREGARGALRTYLHRIAAADPFRARAEAMLARWGAARPR